MKKPAKTKTVRSAPLQDLEKAIGARIRKRRMELGLTQIQLAGKLGLSYQQIQKYETGLNRISAGRLHQISRLLFIDTSYFFKGLDRTPESSSKTNFKIPVIYLEGMHLDKNVQQAIANLVSVMSKHIH